jgi:hypothetical protein
MQEDRELEGSGRGGFMEQDHLREDLGQKLGVQISGERTFHQRKPQV